MFCLTTPSQFWVGPGFYITPSRPSIWQTMDVLVVLGTSAAYFYSLFAVTAGIFTSDPADQVLPVLFYKKEKKKQREERARC